MPAETIRIPESKEEFDQLSRSLKPLETFDRASAGRLLRFLLGQAMADRMSKVAVSVDPVAGQSYMKYARRNATGQFDSWDMVAPPAEMFPFLLQHALAVAELQPSMPLRGTILGARGDDFIRIAVAVSLPDSFELEWGERRT